ncbi:MAG: hypothetical protein IPH13_11860 [Planctomycetes bacterium]|nr:hypothetical protein [Planctomycetota bacterium]MCC7172726.1 hypothetical protein [Planctomycetota bacterium]
MRMKLDLHSIVGLLLCCVFAACEKAPKAKEKPAPAPETPKAPLIQKAEIADWCPEHTVPESICTRCNSSLIAGFQAKGDWCKEHGLPESQCFTCHPDLKAKFEAMAPKKK